MNWSVKAVCLLMKVMALFTIFLPMMTIAVAILSPRIPPFFGYFLCRLGHDFEVLGDPCRIRDILNIRNLLSFKFSGLTCIFGILNGCICLAVYMPGTHVAHLMATYEILPSLIFQKDCLSQFHAEISHATFRDYKKTLVEYRQLQLLSNMFNEIYSRNFFAIVMASSIIVVVPSGYLLMTSYHINQMVLIALGFATVMEYAIITTIFTVASKVWIASVKFKDAWKMNTRLSSRPLTRRRGASLQNMKIKIGSSNFVERNTPFVFVSFCIEQTITLVLLNNF
jgi:hypothetical protein